MSDLPVNVGEVIGGKYRVDRVIGAGGMGVVVAAKHLELDTVFAIKLMLPDGLRDAEQVERFSREARAMVRLTSPNCARVFDVGRLANGAPYMVMELLVGEDLGELLERTPQPLAIPDVIGWMLQACAGVGEAHANGIIHRDLKPRNMFLVRRPDGSALVKVLDFGLAKSIQNMTEAERTLTRTAAIMGSPAYMSPEQMKARREVDEGTDIWSLGVCLYELLTRRAPFEAMTLPELCALVLTETPQPPSVHRADIPRSLDAIVMRCLEKDRARRFRNVGELAQALRSYAEPGFEMGSFATTTDPQLVPAEDAWSQARTATATAPAPRRVVPITILLTLFVVGVALSAFALVGRAKARREVGPPAATASSEPSATASASPSVSVPEPAPPASETAAPAASSAATPVTSARPSRPTVRPVPAPRPTPSAPVTASATVPAPPRPVTTAF